MTELIDNEYEDEFENEYDEEHGAFEYVNAINGAGHATALFTHGQNVKYIALAYDDVQGNSNCCYPILTTRWNRLVEKIKNRSFGINDSDLENIFHCQIAGVVAEELYFNEDDGHSDHLIEDERTEEIFSLTGEALWLSMFLELGNGHSTFRERWKKRMIEETKALLKPHIDTVEAIANEIMQHKFIDGHLAKAIFKEYSGSLDKR